jgi:hypothetical protein
MPKRCVTPRATNASMSAAAPVVVVVVTVAPSCRSSSRLARGKS